MRKVWHVEDGGSGGMTMASSYKRDPASPWIRNDIQDRWGRVRAYAWTKAAGRATSPRALVSAHGAGVTISGEFPQTKYEVFYYCNHGNNLYNPTLGAFIHYIVPIESVGFPGNGQQDYLLTKFQKNKSPQPGDERYSHIQALPRDFRYDLVTIKDKYFLYDDVEGIEFSKLIDILFYRNYKYTEFHASFCRGMLRESSLSSEFMNYFGWGAPAAVAATPAQSVAAGIFEARD
jgi:hypothetical protein